MPFRKNNQYRWESEQQKALDKVPICFKGYEGQKEKLKSIQGWQEKLRIYVDRLIAENGS